MVKQKETVSELWERIFDRLDILSFVDQGEFYEITAETIKEYKEPRLMTKFDFKSQLPAVFKDNKLGILPIDNGKYVIGHFELYKKFPNQSSEEIKEMSIPSYITTIDPDNIYSEANALHAANVAGILQDFIGEDVIETISGRMRPLGFGLNVSNSKEDNMKYSIPIYRPQIEIDGGYEGKNVVVLIEAKNRLSEDFIIRQLYFPLRYWISRTNKEIKTIYLVYDNGVYTLYEYEFMDTMDYNSLRLKKSAKYSIKYPELIPFLKDLLKQVEPTIDDNNIGVPFLQANSMNTLIELTQKLQSEEIYSLNDIAEIIGYDLRQGAYYTSACRYLGIMERIRRNEYRLTQIGTILNEFSRLREINKWIIRQLVQHPIFYEAITDYVETEKVNTSAYYAGLIRKYIIDISGKTIPRRASTLQSWMRWIAGSNV